MPVISRGGTAGLNTRAAAASPCAGSSSRFPRSTSRWCRATECPRISQEVVALADLVAAILERRVLAAGPALLADPVQPLGVDGETEQPVAMGKQRRRQAAVGEVVGRQRKVRRADAELQREIERGRRLAAAGDADQDHLRLGEIARRRAVVVRLREVDRVHPREVLVAVGDAVRASGRVRALGVELDLERRDEDLEEVERERLRLLAHPRAHRLVDDRAEHDRRAILGRRVVVDLADHGVDLLARIDERNRVPLELELLELRQQAVAEHLGGDAGAVGDEEDGAAIGHAEGCGRRRPPRRCR